MSEARLHAPPEADARIFPLAPGLFLVGVLCWAGNALGIVLTYPDIGAAVFYPPYAVLTAALLHARRRDWKWYLLVAALAHLAANWPTSSLAIVLLTEVANIVRVLVAVWLLRWMFRGSPRFDNIRSLLSFVACGVVVAPAVGATIGAATVALPNAAAGYWDTWLAWSASNALTGLTLLPPLLLGAANLSRWRAAIARERVVEALLLASALTVTCVFVFLIRVHGPWDIALRLYAPLPFLIWAALRFGPTGASLSLCAVALAAILGADRETGPILVAPSYDNVLALQLYVLLTTLPVMCIAVVASDRHVAVQLYRALLSSLEDQVAILDVNGVVLEVNDSWQRFADASHLRHFERVSVGDDYLRACRTAVRAGDLNAARALDGIESVLSGQRRRFEMEYDEVRLGKADWYTMTVEPLERPDGGAVVTRANISVRRQAQMEIEEQRRELSHLARVAVLGQLSGALAHELSQPLASILSNAEAARHLLQRHPADLEELRAIIQDIVTEDRRAGQVMHRLRAMLKRGETRLQTVDVGELVHDVLELAHAELITRRVTATSHVAQNLPVVLGDRVQLQQVLLNLMLNACEAMGSTTPSERVLSLTVQATVTGDVQFSMRDRGSGIPPMLIDRLFEPFVTTKPEGLGLGLSISRAIVAAHGGRLWAENNADGGATVHCILAAEHVELVPSDAMRDERSGAMLVPSVARRAGSAASTRLSPYSH